MGKAVQLVNNFYYVTLWLCQDCMLHHANGECSGCHDGHDETPLNKTDHTSLTMGIPRDGHECGRQDGEDVDECDCETNTFSTSQCDGCGSYLHGERHGFTEFVKA